jgi:imidazolonepropionase-like amidohydrolase
MKKTLGPFLVAWLFAPGSIALAQTVVIEAERVMTSAERGTVGPSVIVVREGKIASIGSGVPRDLPADTVRLEAAVVTPGLIDARTTLGLSGLISADDDRDELGGPNQAHLRALDAFNLREPMLEHALRSGVTVVQSGPGKANSIGGQAGIFKTHASSTKEATIRFPSAVVFSLTESAKTTYGKDRKFPSTRMANVGLIRQALVDAEHYARSLAGEKPPDRDLTKEALTLVLEKKVPTLISTERVDEIATAMRLAEEFGLEWALVGATDLHLLMDQLAETSVPVLLGPPGDALFEADPNIFLMVPAGLRKRTVPFALVSGDDESAPRVSLIDQARWAVRGGLTGDEALAAVTLSPARILGIDHKVGSVEIGKDADLVLYDGDPFSYATQVVAVLVDGAVAHQR